MTTQSDVNQFDTGDNKVKFSDLFEFQRVLGNGSFGVVVAALQKPSMKECAVKIIMKKSLRSKNLESLWKEAQILQQLNHPNIVKFIAINESETRIFIVMELVRGGQLQSLIQERNKAGKPFSDEEAAIVMRNILAGLRYIHLKDIVHRDLKPENILLDDKNDLSSVKICDFGLSAQYDNNTCTRSFNEKCGTDIFMAPELWKKKRYSKPVDMWSCGIIMYMLLSGGKHPLYKHGDSQESYLKKLENAQWPLLPNFNKYSKDLFLKLVHEEPCERYSVEQVQDHPWITRRFHDDIPLTSSQKIAAFSHSQILSRILKSIYLMYTIPNMNKEKSEEEEQNELAKQLDKQKQKSCSIGSKSSKSEEETCHGFDSDSNSLKIPIIEEESPLDHMSEEPQQFEADIPKLRFTNAPVPGRDSKTPTPGGLTRKAAPSFSTQESSVKSNVRQINTKREKEGSAVGSLAELETTQGSNPSSQQEEKNTKQYLPSCSEFAVQTEPSKTSDDERVKLDSNRALDRATYGPGAASFARRRDSKSNKIPENIVNGRYQPRDSTSIDLGQKWEANRSANKTADDKNKGKTVHNVAHVTNFGSVDNIDRSRTPVMMQTSEHSQTARNIANIISIVTPLGMRGDKGKSDFDSMCQDLRIREEEANPSNYTEKRCEGEISRKQLLKNKIRKESEAGALPNLGKIKQRQNSLPVKKKALKEKSILKLQEGQKSLNVTGGGPRSTTLSGDGSSHRNIIEDRKGDILCKKNSDESRLETRHDSKRSTPFSTPFKTPQKEYNQEVGGLPMIKQEMKTTKLSWVNSSERGISQKKTGNFGTLTGTLHRPGNKLVKV